MSPSPPPPSRLPTHRTIAWLEPEQAGLVRAIGMMAGLRFVGAGTEARGRSAEVALSLATKPVGDLRAALATATFEGDTGGPGEAGVSARDEGVDLVFLAGPGAFGADSSSEAHADREAVRTCRERGVSVVSLEPIPASVLALAEPTAGTPEIAEEESGEGRGGGLARFVPRLRSSKRCRELGDVLGGFGPPRAIQVESLGRRSEGSLGARLFDAVDAVRWLLGDPESVHAVYVPGGGSAGGGGGGGGGAPGERSSPRDLPTDTLGGVHGTMSVNLRFGDGRAAHILASDGAASWSRTITLLGDGSRTEAGMLRVGDDTFQWVGADGRQLETTKAARRRTKPGADSVHATCADAIAAQVRELLTGRLAAEPPIESARVLATAGAALLSARTGQAESVATVLRMMGMGVG